MDTIPISKHLDLFNYILRENNKNPNAAEYEEYVNQLGLPELKPTNTADSKELANYSISAKLAMVNEDVFESTFL